MDAIEALDDGAVAHFGFQASQLRGILPYMEPAYYLSGFVGIGVLLALIVIALLLQGRRRAALVAIISFAAAFALIEAARFIVPRARPQDAVLWLGADAKIGSYPSAGVFLLLLGMILLGNVLWGIQRRRWQRGLFVAVAALLTVWVCLSQLFLSIHYVTDIIGGLAGATLIGWIAIFFMNRATSTPPTNEPIPAPAAPSDAIQDLARTHGIQKSETQI